MRCLIGFHNWTKWVHMFYSKDRDFGTISDVCRRSCETCGRVQIRYFKD